MAMMGGTMFIVGPKWSRSIGKHGVEPSGLGTIMWMELLKCKKNPIRIMSMYLIPKPSQDPGRATMISRIKAYLKTAKSPLSLNPREFQERYVEAQFTEAEVKGQVMIAGGDLNAVVDQKKGYKDISAWVSSMHAKLPLKEYLLPFHEYATKFYNNKDQPISRIDHILTSHLPKDWLLADVEVDNHSNITSISDYRPILGLAPYFRY